MMMRFIFVALLVLVAASSSVLGGSLRGGVGTTVTTSSTTIQSSSEDRQRRILNDVEESDSSESESDSESEDYVPIVSDDCDDTHGLIEVAVNTTYLLCKEIKKTKICDRLVNEKYLYESCEKSCGVCVQSVPTTDAPTEDLVDLVFTDSPSSDESYYPSASPVEMYGYGDDESEIPTAEPSSYPTDSIIVNITTEFEQAELLENVTADASTDPPTSFKLVDLHFEDYDEDGTTNSTKYPSSSPSTYPTYQVTEMPTVSPSSYPTIRQTEIEDMYEDLFDGLDDDLLLLGSI